MRWRDVHAPISASAAAQHGTAQLYGQRNTRCVCVCACVSVCVCVCVFVCCVCDIRCCSGDAHAYLVQNALISGACVADRSKFTGQCYGVVAA